MVVHCQKEPYDVLIDRRTKWGNPFFIGSHGTRAEVIAKYEKYIRENLVLMAALPELKGKVLGCWCAPQPCHGNILRKLLVEQGIEE